MTTQCLPAAIFGVLLSATALSAPEPAITSFAATPASADEVTLFAFDNYSIPFQRNLYLTMRPARKYAGNPIVTWGTKGAPDEYATQLYGSVMRIGGKF